MTNECLHLFNDPIDRLVLMEVGDNQQPASAMAPEFHLADLTGGLIDIHDELRRWQEVAGEGVRGR